MKTSCKSFGVLAWVASNIFKEEMAMKAHNEKEKEKEEATVANETEEEWSSEGEVEPKGKKVKYDTDQYWLLEDWIPLDEHGYQKSPQHIRTELEEYMANSDSNKTALLLRLGINANSFRKFMLNNYKDPWSATQNGTYWAAARMFEAERVTNAHTAVAACSSARKKRKGRVTAPPKKRTKRSAAPCHRNLIMDTDEKKHVCMSVGGGGGGVRRGGRGTKTNVTKAHDMKKELRDTAVQLMQRISSVKVHVSVSNSKADRQMLVQKIKRFLDTPGVSKVNFCREALLGTNSKTLAKLIRGDVDHNTAYDRAYVFFCKKRVLDKNRR